MPPSKFDHAVGPKGRFSKNLPRIQIGRLRSQEAFQPSEKPARPDAAAANIVSLDALQVKAKL